MIKEREVITCDLTETFGKKIGILEITQQTQVEDHANRQK